MPLNVYYFRPFAQPVILRRLAKAYRLIPIDRKTKLPPEWELPAVLLADAARKDLVRLEQLAPRTDSWRVVCLVDGNAPRQSKLGHKIFAMLPRGVPAITLEKTVQSAFENLRALGENRKIRGELHRAALKLQH